MMMITFSEEFLTRTPEYFNEWDHSMANWDGILNPGKRCKRSFEKAV